MTLSILRSTRLISFFFFNDTATTEIYTLSLHDALPIDVDRAQGPRKWDVDGHEYVDYWMGHGALFLGHCHPAVVRAVQEQMARGTHVGACHELEVRWAELVNRLVPCAELVRFTMSG